MTQADKTEASTPSEREVMVKRTFDAPRSLVFDAFTKPDMVMNWLYGPDDWRIVHCEIDLRVGGAFRYIWRHDEKGEIGLSGVFKEVVPPERLVYTELFDQDWTGGETLVTTVFEERNGRTTVTTTVLYASQDARDGALKTGMLEGWSQGYDRLDLFLESQSTGSKGSAADKSA